MLIEKAQGFNPYLCTEFSGKAQNVFGTKNYYSEKVGGIKADSFVCSSAQQNEANQPISFKEGLGIFAQGFKNKLKGMVTSIVKHPIKTALIVGGTIALMSLLPLIGISTVAAGSALTLIYAGIAVGKTAVDTGKFIKNNKNGQYDEARKNLSSMGGDTLDLAVSLPFVPKAIKNVKDFAKYGRIGINHELANEIKNANKLTDKVKVLKNGNVKISEEINYKKAVDKVCGNLDRLAEFEELRSLPNDEFTQKIYEKITEEMGIKDTAPNFTMSDSMQSNTLGGFNKSKCSIEFNAQRFSEMKQSEIINTVRHELEHYQQAVDIARYKGPEYITELTAKAYVERVKRGANVRLQEKLQKMGEEAFTQDVKNQLEMEGGCNIKAYEEAVKAQGRILPGTAEALQAEKYIQATLDYPDLTFCIFGPPQSYIDNPLEVGARAAGENPGGVVGEYKEVAATEIKVPDTYIADITKATVQGETIIVNN